MIDSRVTLSSYGTVALDSSQDGFEDVATGGSRAIALVEGGAPPSEYLMFGPGVNETVKGPLLFDDEAAKAVEAFYAERGRKRLAGDWEHDSMVPSGERAPGYKGSPASHWFALEVRPGPELWAVDVKWTPTAFAQIQAGEYAHTSPVVKFQKATGRIVAVLSSALTNDPATIGQPQLVAASAESTKPQAAATPEKPNMEPTMGTYKMADEPAGKVKAIVDGAHKDEAEMAGKLKACLSESFPAHFGQDHKEPDGDEGKMKADEMPAAKLADKGEVERKADEMEEKKELSALRADLENLTGKKTRGEQIAALTAMKIMSEEVVTLSAKLTEKASAQFDAVLTSARTKMVLTPADCAPNSRTKRGQYIETLRATHDVVALRAFVEPLGAVVTTTETAAKEAKAADVATAILSADERASLEKNGVDVVAYLKNKQQRLAEGDAFRA